MKTIPRTLVSIVGIAFVLLITGCPAVGDKSSPKPTQVGHNGEPAGNDWDTTSGWYNSPRPPASANGHTSSRPPASANGSGSGSGMSSNDLEEEPVRIGTRTVHDSGYMDVTVLYGTDRQRRLNNASIQGYTGDRSFFKYGTALVTVPLRHKVGRLESPSWTRFEFRQNKRKHVVLASVEELPVDSMFARLTESLEKSKSREALIFIHGFNVTFENAARRTAQLAVDLYTADSTFDVVPILYSWPSHGRTKAYLADEENIEWTIPHLEKFLTDVVECTGAKKLNVIAHSMGNRALAAAISAMGRAGKDTTFNQVVLTAPDIPADIFLRDIVPYIPGTARRLTLYASSKDIALAASRNLHDSPRLGESGRRLVVARGFDTIDATMLGEDMLGHSYFATTPPALLDISKLWKNISPDDRGLTKVPRDSMVYWKF